MPIFEVIAEIVIEYVVTSEVGVAVIDATTLVADASTGALRFIGIPEDIAKGAITVGGDSVKGGLIGAGLGAGQAALTNQDILEGALMGGAGGAVGLGLGNLASGTIEQQAASIFSKSTAKMIGETVGQGIGGFAGGVASGASLKDSATMGALGSALGAYSAGEINAANEAKLVNKKLEDAEKLLVVANESFARYNKNLKIMQGWQADLEAASKAAWEGKPSLGGIHDLERMSGHYVTPPPEEDFVNFQKYYDAYNKLDANTETMQNSLIAADKDNKAYQGSKTVYETALSNYEKGAAADFAKEGEALVAAKNAELKYEQDRAPAISASGQPKALESFSPEATNVSSPAGTKLGEEMTITGKRPASLDNTSAKLASEKPLIEEMGGERVSKKGTLGRAAMLALDTASILYPFGATGGATGTGTQQGTPPPQGGLTSTATPGPGSSALAQVLNQGGAGAPVFGTQEGKGKKSKWNIASLRYMGNQDKGA